MNACIYCQLITSPILGCGCVMPALWFSAIFESIELSMLCQLLVFPLGKINSVGNVIHVTACL